MRHYITKAQALQLAGHWRNDLLQGRYHLEREGRTSGAVFCVFSGAKIYMVKVGCVWRFHLMGYTSDGRDVQECLDLLKRQRTKYRLVREDGITSHFFGEADFVSSNPYSVARAVGFDFPSGMHLTLEKTIETIDEDGKTVNIEVANLR